MKTAQQMAANWQQAMSNPATATKYKQGIASTTVNPMQKAAQPDAEALYLANVQRSVASGRRAARLNAVPLERWKNNAINIGSTLLSSGAQKAMDKTTAHFQKWAPIYGQMHDAAAALPKGGLANALARVQAAISVAMAAAGRM